MDSSQGTIDALLLGVVLQDMLQREFDTVLGERIGVYSPDRHRVLDQIVRDSVTTGPWLAEKLELPSETVRDTLRDLKAAGLIKLGERRYGRAVTYQVTLEGQDFIQDARDVVNRLADTLEASVEPDEFTQWMTTTSRLLPPCLELKKKTRL